MTIVDELLQNTPPKERAALERIRTITHQLCPGCEEVKTYGMPGFKYKGKYLLSFAAFKGHLSLFPGAEPVENLREELQPYRRSKGTIQFTNDKPLSDEVVMKLALQCKHRIDTK